MPLPHYFRLKTVALALGLPIVLSQLGCQAPLRKFPISPPMWTDNDKQPLPNEPAEYFSSFLWDGADQMVFRPIAKFWKVDPAGESVNVNSVDEVPDSAWFTNRIARFPYDPNHLTPEQSRRGPCNGPSLDPGKGPWLVTGAKPNGANPGFPIKAADGRRYMLKFDGVVQGPRATIADVVVSKIYYAAGFSVPCNEVVLFDRGVLKIKEGASSEDAQGNRVPLTETDLDKVFSKAIRLPDGRYRGSSSLFLKGRPIGPFRYEGTRRDDPNDVIPHQDRRELRGSFVLAGWSNHFDSREQNTLDMYVAADDRPGYIQHSILDFGDCLGSIWEPPQLGRRIGHSGYFDGGHITVDLLTLGLLKRPWEGRRFGPTGTVLGYYDIESFNPDAYRTGYPNPAMLRMSERDGAWMARIMARITPAHVRSMIKAGKISDPALEKELTRVLLGRRRKSLARYLGGVSALTEPTLSSGGGEATLCMEDLGVTTGIMPRATAAGVPIRHYEARLYRFGKDKGVALAGSLDGANMCVRLPREGGSAEQPRYLVVDMVAVSGSQNRSPARVHLYHSGGSDYKVVGLERPYDDEPPG